MKAWALRLAVQLWRELLKTLDVLWPGWSQPGASSRNEFGAALSSESLNYWLHAERVRRTLD